MALLRAIELTLLAAVIYGFFTQVIAPLWRGTVLLPWFRSNKQRKLEGEITKVRQSRYENDLEVLIEKEKKRIEKGREQLT